MATVKRSKPWVAARLLSDKLLPKAAYGLNNRVIPRIAYKIRHRPLPMSSMEGPEGRLRKLRETVTALIKHERIELNFNRGTEARMYTERLITEAIRNGDCHKPTMELADYWLMEKQLIHKLFKVLAPRFSSYSSAYTRQFNLPKSKENPQIGIRKGILLLELKGNPFPSVITDKISSKNQLQNILLEAARHDFKKELTLKKQLLDEQVTEVVEESVSSEDLQEIERGVNEMNLEKDDDTMKLADKDDDTAKQAEKDDPTTKQT